jgi:hypothetical protein
MIHAMGYAFDVSAKETPRSPSAPGTAVEHDPKPIRHVGADKAHMDLGKSNERFIESMGKRTAKDEKLSAADDTDAATVQYFQRFEQQFLQMQAGSRGFTQSISKTNRDKLLEIRKVYFDVLKALAAERKKGSKSDKQRIAALEASRRPLPWPFPACD